MKVSLVLLLYLLVCGSVWLVICLDPSFLVPPKGNDYCSPGGEVETSCCSYSTIEDINRALSPTIEKLLGSLYFRYYKINLHRSCPFWKENPFCLLNSCAVTTCEKNEIPFFLVKYEDLAKVTYPPVEHNILYLKKLSDEFCELENNDKDAVFVNLLDNPERFTGYSGDNAARVWKIIYGANRYCEAKHAVSLDANPDGSIDDFSISENDCIERKLYYRIISGMHASISAHIAISFLNTGTGKWEKNFELFHDRVGAHSDRIKNMFFVYMVVLRALTKASAYLEDFPFLDEKGNPDHKLLELVNSITKLSSTCPTKFENAVFNQPNNKVLINDMKHKFQIATRVLDCVSCEKCRLWGKIQFTGIATSLKIIFTNPDVGVKSGSFIDYKLSREEVVALFLVLGRLSESLSALDDFRTMYHDAKLPTAASKLKPATNIHTPRASCKSRTPDVVLQPSVETPLSTTKYEFMKQMMRRCKSFIQDKLTGVLKI